MYNWGSVLLNSAPGGPKPRTQLDADLLIRNLGYWTDNGALAQFGCPFQRSDPVCFFQTLGVPGVNLGSVLCAPAC